MARSDRYSSKFQARQAEAVDSLLKETPELQDSLVAFCPGEMILKEGQENDRLFVIVRGEARLSKASSEGTEIEVDTFGPGGIVGLTSFWSREPVFARIEAITEVESIAIDLNVFNALVEKKPEFARKIQGLFVSNLSDRYRHMVLAQVESFRLSRLLEEERNQLRDTLAKLEGMTKRLVNQEKLATMGQLLAGIAHEINNPVGALLRGVESAQDSLGEVYGVAASDSDSALMLNEGVECPFWSPSEIRDRMEGLQQELPDVKRSLIRRIARLTEKARSVYDSVVGDEEKEKKLLGLFELGVCLRSMQLSAGRIERIVRSLKNYGRATQSTWSTANLTDGIRDTLTVLNNRLKRYDLQLELGDIPPIQCNLSEMNQVWTNLIVNAMDACSEGTVIRIVAKQAGDVVEIRIEDAGPGIPEDKRAAVFEPNYTTKNQSGSFGLGIGLSISKDIVEKHSGTIFAGESDLGGAAFVVRIPIASD